MLVYSNILLATVTFNDVVESKQSTLINSPTINLSENQETIYGASIQEVCDSNGNLENCRALLLESKPFNTFHYKANFERSNMSFSSCPITQGLSELGGQWTSSRGKIEMRGTLSLYKINDYGGFAFIIDAKPYEISWDTGQATELSKAENDFRSKNGLPKINVDSVFQAHKDAPVYFASQNRYGMFDIEKTKIGSNNQVHLDFNLEEGGNKGRRINLIDGLEGPCFESYNVELIVQR